MAELIFKNINCHLCD